MAEERCPAMYSMSHEIKVNAQIKYKPHTYI